MTTATDETERRWKLDRHAKLRSPPMRLCDNCRRPFGLNVRELPRKWDWGIFYWRVFHNRNCKREWVAKRKAEKKERAAISTLYRQHRPP